MCAVSVCRCVHGCTQRPEVDISCLLQLLATLFIQIRVSLNLALPNSTILPRQQAPGIYLSLLLSCYSSGVTGAYCHTQLSK